MSQQHGPRTIWATWSDEHLQEQWLVEILKKLTGRFIESGVAFGYDQDVIDQCAEFVTGGNARNIGYRHF